MSELRKMTLLVLLMLSGPIVGWQIGKIVFPRPVKAAVHFPSVGDVVYYQLPDGSPNAGLSRPAVIIVVHDQQTCDIVVFNNGQDDLPGQSPASFVPAVVHDEFGDKGTWHFRTSQNSGILH